MEATLLYASQCYLGEGPLWHAGRNSCFWVDIDSGALYELKLKDKTVRTWKFDAKMTVVLEGINDELIVSLDTTIAKFNPNTEKLTRLLDVETAGEIRCNDGNCDSFGRLWIGTMHLQHFTNMGSLYCIENNHTVNKKVSNTTISNGIAWSLDNKRLYFIDSPKQVVQSFAYDAKTADIRFEKNCIFIPTSMGTPDGMTIDEEGMLWVAHWGGFGVYRWSPVTGELLDTIKLPVPNVTSCAFAGKRLDQLIITTAREGLSIEELQKYPQSGNLFLATPKVKGVAGFKCSL